MVRLLDGCIYINAYKILYTELQSVISERGEEREK